MAYNRGYRGRYDVRGGGRYFRDTDRNLPDNERDEPISVIKDMFNEKFMIDNNSGRISRTMGSRLFTLNKSRSRCDQIFPYSSNYVKRLLFNKHVALIGDSLIRAIYKDLVQLLQSDHLVPPNLLKSKTEHTCLGDRQVDSFPLDADKVFKQAREYCTDHFLVQYQFTTRAIKDDIEKFILQWQKSGEFPDLVIVNSAIWDLTRYYDYETDMSTCAPYERNPESQLDDETFSMNEYMERISILMRRFRLILPPNTQVIWLLMPWPLPVGSSAILRSNPSQRKLHRSIYLDGNYRAAQIVSSAGYDVLDLSFYMRNHGLYPLRVHDGIHWSSAGTRLQTQLIIGHLSKNLSKPTLEVKTSMDKCSRLCRDGRTFASKSKRFLEDISRNTDSGTKANDRQSCYYNKLQRNLAEDAFRRMPNDVKEAVAKDIQNFRISELIRTRNLKLTTADQSDVQKEALQMPAIKEKLDPTDYKVQRVVIMARRPNRKD